MVKIVACLAYSARFSNSGGAAHEQQSTRATLQTQSS